jgi:hypothetical protein
VATYDRNRTTLAQKLALAFGAVFLIVGIAGFVPGITTNLYDGLDFAGDGSEAELLGIFQVSVLHNLVHMLFGIGILAAARHDTAMQYLLASGLVYVALFVLGILGGANWVPVDEADDWLHLGLSAALLGAWGLGKAEENRRVDDEEYDVALRTRRRAA